MKRATDVINMPKYKYIISIHALVKRATYIYKNGKYCARISIHALVKRATCIYIIKRGCTIDFNPRPREEGDGDILGTTGNIGSISIHALVKRATQ